MKMLNNIWWLRKFTRFSISHVSSSIHSQSSSSSTDFVTWNKRIYHLFSCGHVSEARSLFDRMPHKNIVTWNSMITGYIRHNDITNARILFDQMPERNVFSWNTMISGFSRIGRIADAESLFNSMPDRNAVSWNAMLTGFLQNGEVSRAVEFYAKMPERDSASLSALLSGLIQNGNLDLAMIHLLEHDRSKFYGEEDGLLHAYNTLVAGFGQRGRIDDARLVFDMIPWSRDKKFRRNNVSWNSMITCYVKAGDMVSARSLFDQMEGKDTFAWNTMISGYAHVSNMTEALKLFHVMPSPDTLSWNSIVSGFARLGKLELARDSFEQMPQKNIVSWNSMISGYGKNGDLYGAIALYTRMQVEGHKPDKYTLSSVLDVCTEVVALRLGVQIHQQVMKLGIADMQIKNLLIAMYSRCGSILEATAIFEEVRMPKNVFSWTAMIEGHASHGDAYKALELFNLMKQIQVRPTYVTYISVLKACANFGLVEEGKTHFKSMAREFGTVPRIEQFTSLVNILCQLGLVEELVKYIKGMPVEPDKSIWGAVLGACSVHKNVECASEAAELWMTVEPESSGPYLLLQNVLVNTGRFDEANEARTLMEKKTMYKRK